MRWANFLHIYQPFSQQPDILEAIVSQSYRPILEGLKKNPKIRLTFNITGALLELLDKYGYKDLIDILRELESRHQIEFTGSAKYHALLPFLSPDEMTRQISANSETLKFFLGDGYAQNGFFPPEMAYSPSIIPVVEQLGFKWILLDEIALTGEPGHVDYTKTYLIKDSKLKVFFRERRLSNLIMSAVVRSPETLREAMKDDRASERYVLTAMDGETFGHHRPGLEKMLFDVLSSPDAELITISEIPKYYPETAEIVPKKSTWASSKQDIDQGIQFLSWFDPSNKIHGWQSELSALTVAEVYAMDKSLPRYNMVRIKMDAALASDHFWWASAKPWWSVEMIEEGAFRLLEVLRLVPAVTKDKLDRASKLYENIISTAFSWQRTGKIREMMKEQGAIMRIPFKDRTIGKGGDEIGVYDAFMTMMARLEKEAALRGEYEKAILWRDSKYKLENKLDIYDTVNAIDLLRVEIPHNEVEATIEQYKEKYRALRGGQPEQRGS